MSSESLPRVQAIGSVACIGAGAMGEALVSGMLRARLVTSDDVWMADADDDRLQHVTSTLGVHGGRNQDAAARVDVVIVAVKPEFVTDVLADIGPVLQSGALVVSVAAGVPIAALERELPKGTAVVRVMPNTPALVGAGATALAKGSFVTEEQIDVARRIFASVGTAVVVPESLLDAVTGLSGSGPAYVYMFIEALADGGVRAGLPREVAQSLAAQTVLGAARTVLETGMHPGQLKDMVTSPAGTTIAGVSVLEGRGFRGTCIEAVYEAARRSRELGDEQEDSSL